MTGAGYGEIVPITEIGKLLVVVSTILGMLFFALPVILVGWHFVIHLNEWYTKRAMTKFQVLLNALNKAEVKQLC